MIVWSECCWQRRDWRSRSVLIADDGWTGSLTIIGCSGTKCLELAQTLHAWTGFTTWSIIVNLNFQHFRLKTATLPPDHGTASLVEVTLRLVSLAVSSTDWSIDWAAPAPAAAALGHLLLELSGLASTLGTQLTWSNNNFRMMTQQLLQQQVYRRLFMNNSFLMNE